MLAVVFFMLYLKKKKKKTISVCVCPVCVGQNQLYLLVVPDGNRGNRRHFHLANIAGVWYVLWFCGFLSLLLSVSLKFAQKCVFLKVSFFIQGQPFLLMLYIF